MTLRGSLLLSFPCRKPTWWIPGARAHRRHRGSVAYLAGSGRLSFPFGALFEDGPYGMLVASEQRRLLDANARACALLGYERNELTGRGLNDVADPTDERWAKALSGQETGELDLRLLRRDGSVFAAWVVLTGWSENNVDPLGVVFGQRSPEAEPERGGRGRGDACVGGGPMEGSWGYPEEAASNLLTLVGGPWEAMAMLKPDGAVVYAGGAVEGILGCAPNELTDGNILNYVHPEDEQRIREVFVEASRSDGPVGPSELRMRHADGSWLYLKMRVSSYLGAPDVTALVVGLNDVTKQKAAEEALLQSEGRYRAVVEQAREGIYLADARTMGILEVNAALCESLGYTADELRRLKLYDIVAHEPQSVDRNVLRTLEEGRCHIGERKYRRKDGSFADVDVCACVVPHAGKDVLCVVADDLTGRKRAEENLRRSLGVLLALREAGQILGSTLETEEIVTRLLTIMRGVSGLTAAVISVEDDSGQPKIWREVGLEGLWRRARYASQAEEARRVVLDSGRHQLFRLQNPEGRGRLVGLCLPLRIKDRIAGVLEAYGPESLSGKDAVEILRSLAAQAASALENAQLYGELAERERRLADLIGQLFTAQEEERRRVSYEVHDGLAQVAAAAHQHLQGFATLHPPGSEDGQALLSQALELVQRTVGEARRVIANLRPTALDDFGLGTALRMEADRLRAEGYDVDYESNLHEGERLSVAAETALFRIAQEALTNIRKHAGARRARVTLDRLESRARLSIRDWGRGFDPAAPRVEGGPGERVGLNSMQERVALLGGSFLVQSRPGTGALVTVEVPLPAGKPLDGNGPLARLAGPEEAYLMNADPGGRL